MHFTIFVYGTWGDIRPHVVLGQALQQRGHDVQVVASTGYEQWVRDRGLDFYPLTVDVNTFSKDNAHLMDQNFLQQIQMVRKTIRPIMAQMGMETMEATRDSDVLLTVEFGISLLFDVVKANKLKPIFINPANLNPTRDVAFTAFTPGRMPFPGTYNRMTYSMIRRLQWNVFAGARKDIRAPHGLPNSRFKDFRALVDTAPALTAVSRHIFPCPLDWPEHWQVTGYLFDDDPHWTPPQDLLDFLDTGEKPVYIGFGSMPDSNPTATTRLILDAVKQSGRRAVILTGWAGLGADDVPDGIYILKYAPHSWLFPRMAAVVHHGGAGTTASGFRAGVPTVVVPHVGDQPMWGRKARDLGVGTAPIPRKKLTADNLAAAITEATSNRAMRENARALSEKIQTEDGLSNAVAFVDNLCT